VSRRSDLKTESSESMKLLQLSKNSKFLNSLVKRFYRNAENVTDFIQVHPPETTIPFESLYFKLDLISREEENILLDHFEKIFANKTYLGNHWDDVISYYRESELDNNHIPANVRRILLGQVRHILSTLPKFKNLRIRPPHVIDLHPKGRIGRL